MNEEVQEPEEPVLPHSPDRTCEVPPCMTARTYIDLFINSQGD